MEATQAYFKSRFDYDPSTGVLTWKYNSVLPSSWNARFAGKHAGSVKALKSGYRYLLIRLYTKHFSAHRIIWTYMTGEDSPEQIDHINRDALDNRWANLRDAKGQNTRNQSMRINNKSGVTGVCWDERHKSWHAQVGIKINGVSKRNSLGRFKNFEDAKRVVEEFRVGIFDPDHGKFKAVYRKSAV